MSNNDGRCATHYGAWDFEVFDSVVVSFRYWEMKMSKSQNALQWKTNEKE